MAEAEARRLAEEDAKRKAEEEAKAAAQKTKEEELQKMMQLLEEQKAARDARYAARKDRQKKSPPLGGSKRKFRSKIRGNRFRLAWGRALLPIRRA